MAIVLVPLRPGPLRESIDAPAAGIGALDITLAAAGAGLLVATLTAGLPSWLIIVAIALLGLGIGLPLQAALGRRRAIGTHLDVSHDVTRRLATAYHRVEQRADGATLAAAHRIVLEVAIFLDGRPPSSPGDEEYVARRAEAISAL